MRAARAARLFSLARPIKFLVCGVAVAVPVTGELKQPRRRRKRERHLKMSLRVSAIIFHLFKVIMFEKCVLTILGPVVQSLIKLFLG